MSSGFKVIIAGGGIAGLTLANALEKGNIDYLLLERRLDIAPQVGASIGILPNGCRIADQLGCRDQLYAVVKPLLWRYERDRDGKLLARPSTTTRLAMARSGYDLAFGDRQNILRVFYDNLQDKTKILLGKNLTAVHQTPSGVTVTCEDGSTYTGDVLAAADGVNSKARSEMWRLADAEGPELVKKDKESMASQYRCLFGIASSSCGLGEGDVHVGYDTDRSFMVVTGLDDRTYYFVFDKLDKEYKPPNIPRYSDADKERLMESSGRMKIDERLTLADIQKHTVSSSLVALETATYQIWTWGRIACLGDSAHKMTPDAGYGGNAAIESAAALANAIKKLVDSTMFDQEHPELTKVTECLKEYQKTREIRAAAAVEASTLLTRIHALASWGHKLFANYGLGILGEFIETLGADMSVGAAKIDYLPVPSASLKGYMPFNPVQGHGHKESKLKRFLLALPFLALSTWGLHAIDPSPAFPALGDLLQSGKIATDGFAVPIMFKFFGIGWLDALWAPVNTLFTPAAFGYDPAGRAQFFTFLIDFGVIISIYAIEAVRRVNALMPYQLPGIFTMLGQLRGIGAIAPIYYLVFWSLTPIDSFKATDLRLTKLHYTRAILPAILLAYYVPLVGSFFWPNIYQRQAWLFVWQMFPVWIFAAQMLISKLFADTTDEDKLHAPKRDILVIRYTVGIPIAVSTGVWMWTLFTSPAPLTHVFLPHFPPVQFADLALCIHELIKWDQTLMVLSTLLWLGYSAWDMKHGGMVKDGWIKLVLIAVLGTLCVGPGAMAGLGWLWREDIITNKRHKDAITEESVARERRDPGLGEKTASNGKA